VTLAKSVESPFKPKSDEVTGKEEKSKSEETQGKKDEEKKDKKELLVEVKVDVDGLKDRIAGLPIQASSYRHIVSAGSTLYYNRQGTKDEKSQLLMYDFGELK
jgi:hypothetical protein